MHNWHGLIGYCMKDSHEPHFATISHNISEADFALGAEVFLKYIYPPLLGLGTK